MGHALDSSGRHPGARRAGRSIVAQDPHTKTEHYCVQSGEEFSMQGKEPERAVAALQPSGRRHSFLRKRPAATT